MDAELARGVQARLLGLAREEEIEAIVCGLDQVVAGGACRDRDALDRLRPVGEDERLAVDAAVTRATSSSIPSGSRASRQADLAERALALDPERGRELGAVAQLRVGVEREVVRDEGEVGGEQRLEPASLAPVDHERLVPPEDPVMHEHELRLRRRGPFEELAGGGDTTNELRHLGCADTCRPGGPNSENRSTSSNSSA